MDQPARPLSMCFPGKQWKRAAALPGIFPTQNQYVPALWWWVSYQWATSPPEGVNSLKYVLCNSHSSLRCYTTSKMALSSTLTYWCECRKKPKGTSPVDHKMRGMMENRESLSFIIIAGTWIKYITFVYGGTVKEGASQSLKLLI